MKKSTKIILAVLAVVLVLGGLASYFVPMLILKAETKKVLPEAERAGYITDFETKPEGWISVDNTGYTMEIPAYLEKNDYDQANVYAGEDGTEFGAKYIMLTTPYEEEMSLIDAYKDNEESVKKYGIRDVEKMFNALDYGTPDSYYNILKGVCLLDWEDYNILSVRKSVAFSVYAVMRKELYMTMDNYIYERGDVRAIVQTGEEGGYTIDVFRVSDLNAGYSMMIKDANLSFDEMVSMLNTIEFK